MWGCSGICDADGILSSHASFHPRPPTRDLDSSVEEVGGALQEPVGEADEQQVEPRYFQRVTKWSCQGFDRANLG